MDSPCCVETANSAKKRLFRGTLCWDSKNWKPQWSYGDAGWNTLKRRRSRDGHKWESGFWSGIQCILLAHCDFNMDAVFRAGLNTPFPPKTDSDLKMTSTVENPTQPEDEGDEEKSPQSVPVSDKHNEPSTALNNFPTAAKLQIIPDYIYTILFEWFFIHIRCECFWRRLFY